MMIDAYDVPLRYLSRWKAGFVNSRGSLTRAGELAQAESGFRHWWARSRWLRCHMRDNGLVRHPGCRDAIRDYVSRAWAYRRQVRRLRAAP